MSILPDQIAQLERAWIRDRALSNEILDDVVRSTFGYALRLAAAKTLYSRHHVAIDAVPFTAELRDFLWDLLTDISEDGIHYPGDEKAQSGVGTIAWAGRFHRQTLVECYPKVARMLRKTISELYCRFPALDEFSLHDNLQEKSLVLALGGGGGTGYAHLCLFQWLEENDIRPALITGTSFGALLGYVRALQDHYDAAMTMIRLPGYWRVIKDLHPCFDSGTHGLMGLCSVDFNDLCASYSQSAGFERAPAFEDLKIPFACMASGILANSDVIKEIEPQKSGIISSLFKMTQLTWHKAMHHAAQITSLIMRHRESVIPVSFGFDEQTCKMNVPDAVGFSSSVPGVINAEIPKGHAQSLRILNQVFKENALYRLTDGGLAANVPVRLARGEVQRGRLGTQNIWLLGLDVFAPQARDGIFYPLQQIANDNVIEDARDADSLVRLKDLLSPMDLIPSLNRMHWLKTKFRKAFADEMKVIVYAAKPLLPIGRLDLTGF